MWMFFKNFFNINQGCNIGNFVGGILFRDKEITVKCIIVWYFV